MESISLTLTGEFEEKVTERAVREHAEDLLSSLKSMNSEELRGSGIVPTNTRRKSI